MRVARLLSFLSDEQSVDEISRCDASSRGAGRAYKIEELRAVFRRQLPERLLLDDVQTQVPGFCAILVQNLIVRDYQAIRSQDCRVIFHGAQFDEHAPFDRLDEFLALAPPHALLLAPILDTQP